MLRNYSRNLKNILYKIYDWVFINWPSKEKHQLKSSTSYDRYPEIFSVVREHIDSKGLSDVNILSYGCSTGEECFTLRHYFPDAKITGVDINRKNISICKKKSSDKKMYFMYSEENNLHKMAPFDVIFCMSVLCRWPQSKDVDDITQLYSFQKFDDSLKKLNLLLRNGGMFVLYNSNFLFEDSSIYPEYDKLTDSRIPDSGFVQKFNKQNKKIINNKSSGTIFIKE